MSIPNYYTQQGIEKIKNKLNDLKVQRPELLAAVAHARSYGDISENVELDAAREAQEQLERQIANLEEELASARLLDKVPVDSDRVALLSTATVKNKQTGEKLTYTLVGEQEADARAGKISIHTPVAKGLLGKKVGEVAVIQLPRGTVQLEIVSLAQG